MTMSRKFDEASWLRLAVSTDGDAGALGCVRVEPPGPRSAAVATDKHRMHVVWGGRPGFEALAREVAANGAFPAGGGFLAEIGRGANAALPYPDWRRLVEDHPPTGGLAIVEGHHVTELVAVCDGMAQIRRRLGLGSWSSDYRVRIRGSLFEPRYLADALRHPGGRVGWVDVSLSTTSARFDIGQVATALVSCLTAPCDPDKVHSLDRFFADQKASKASKAS